MKSAFVVFPMAMAMLTKHPLLIFISGFLMSKVPIFDYLLSNKLFGKIDYENLAALELRLEHLDVFKNKVCDNYIDPNVNPAILTINRMINKNYHISLEAKTLNLNTEYTTNGIQRQFNLLNAPCWEMCQMFSKGMDKAGCSNFDSKQNDVILHLFLDRKDLVESEEGQKVLYAYNRIVSKIAHEMNGYRDDLCYEIQTNIYTMKTDIMNSKKELQQMEENSKGMQSILERAIDAVKLLIPIPLDWIV